MKGVSYGQGNTGGRRRFLDSRVPLLGGCPLLTPSGDRTASQRLNSPRMLLGKMAYGTRVTGRKRSHPCLPG